jgi:adenylate cyclase, class 2
VAIEYEAKVLDVDPVKISEIIVGRGGRQVGDTVLLRRYVYDVVAGDGSRWIRLRDAGSGSTLTVKQIHHDGIDGTDEVEIGVDQFEATNELLALMGFTARSYQENRRTSFVLDDARLEIDEWPRIPPYLEIEADSREAVLRVAAALGFTEADLTGENTVSVYARHGIDLLALPRVSFDEP